jgi:hypothetical protein
MDRWERGAPGGACRPCSWPIALAAVVVLLVVAAVLLTRRPRRARFTPQQAQAVHSTAQELFAIKGGGLTYSEYKTSAAERGQAVDPVLFTDLRTLWKDDRLTPGEVLRVM